MNKVLQATYRDGNLVLDEKLDVALEGKKLTLILVEEIGSPAPSVAESGQEDSKRELFEWAQQFAAKLPPDYQFDREAAHER